MLRRPSRLLLPLFALVALWLGPVHAKSADPQALLHLLDYIGVDYPNTVQDGKVTNPTEYAEQREFAQRVATQVGQLPAGKARDLAQANAAQLNRLIAEHASGDRIRTLTTDMRGQLIAAFDVVTVPRRQPDLRRAAALFEAQCSSCHGAEGRGDGPAARGLEPAPTNFHDRARADQRSLYGLFSTITLGVADTGMASFDHLKDADRWSLAFYVGSLAYGDTRLRERGDALLANPTEKSNGLFELAKLTRTAPAEALAAQGEDGLALMAALRRHPAGLFNQPSPLTVAAERLDASLAAYRAGDTGRAYQLALSAYLDGFELAESTLRATDPEGVSELEARMMDFRRAVQTPGNTDQANALHTQLIARLNLLRDQSDEARLDAGVAMGSAYVILLREGLEALLVLAAIIGILIKTGRRDLLPYVHAGWIGALALGLATWGASAYLVDISGASRELTEGGTALLAVVVLLYVGFWLHDKSHADQWQAFVKKRIHGALNGRALWALTTVAFLAVYREVFETVLFYQALWLQTEESGQSMLLGGVALAALTLLAAGWIILRSSMRLPLSAFFRVNAAIMFVLALIFAGHGVAGLQKAGALSVTPVDFVQIDLLGIYPTAESLGLQALLLALLAVLMVRGRAVEQPAN